MPPTYLDIYDLAALFGVTPVTILRRLRNRPDSLPFPAYLGPNFPLRWREAEVSRWLWDENAR